MNRRSIPPSLVAAFMILIAMRAAAHDPPVDGCSSSTVDVSRELALMRAPAVPVTAVPGQGSKMPVLVLDKHYAISLIAQKDVAFRVKPANPARKKSPRGGILLLEVPSAGRYRISITSRHWIDVLDGNSRLASAAHHGPECELLHKVVEFDLPAGRPLTLQLSGRDDAIVGLAITTSPSVGIR
jgi:hypothetical protein